MNKSDKFFYDPEMMRIISNPQIIKPEWVEIKEGYILSDGKIIIDDREQSVYQMLKDGLYHPDKHVILSNVVLNPLLYL